MMKIRELFKNLNATDFIIVVFYFGLSIANVIFYKRVDNWLVHIILNSLLIIFVFTIAYLVKHRDGIFIKSFHYLYLVPLIFATFKELYFMIKPIRQIDYDYLLIKIDRMLFGFDPTEELFKIANPYLTELLQIAYASFFFLPIILAVHLLWKDRITDFHFAIFSVMYGFLLSYIGYFMLPAIGPRFTLHDFYATNNELPGLFLTNFLRDMVNVGESIRHGIANPEKIVQRDVFPSGHTQMTLIVMYLSFKFRLKSKYFLFGVGSLLIFGTVYLRYHYVIDLIAGAVFMIFTMWSGYYIFNWWMRKTGREEFSYR